MHISLLLVASINGLITSDDQPDISTWASLEDQTIFKQAVQDASGIIMGRQTYDVVKHRLTHKPGRLRIVYTKCPEKYQADTIGNLLEFTNQPPHQLISQLESRGYRQLLLLGGSHINSLFLDSHLIDELRLTIEPKIFQSGRPLFQPFHTKAPKLKLISHQQLNQAGTVLLIYKITYNKA